MSIRSNLSIFLVAAALATAGCGGDTTSTTTPNPFVGTWNCTGSRVLTFTMPMLPAMNLTESSTITVTESGGQLVVTPSSDGGSVCVTRLTRAGNIASIVTGQTCAQTGAFVGTANLTGGTATAIGNMLTSMYTYTFTGMAGMTAVSGTAVNTSTCTR